jgi:Ni/Co efflux regulator RcnB
MSIQTKQQASPNLLLSLFLCHAIFFSPSLMAKQGYEFADDQGKSEQHGKGHHKKEHGKQEHHANSNERAQESDHYHLQNYFTAQRRSVVVDVYAKEFKEKKCPPGLAKKQNGCNPPGQVRKWRRGHTLPHDLDYHDVSPLLIKSIGPAPSGHRYVRIANDILLIAIGTNMVIDALEDISRQ